MKKKVVTVMPETAIKNAAHLMREKKIGCVPVVSAGALVGLADHHRYSQICGRVGMRRLCLSSAAFIKAG